MKLRIPLAFATSLCFAGSALASPITIDTFDTPAAPLVFIGPANPANGPVAGAGIFGTRTLSSVGTLNGAGDFLSMGGGIFSVGTSATTGYEAVLTYAFAGQNFATDFGVTINFNALDSGVGPTAPMALALTTSTGQLNATFNLPSNGSPFLVFVSFGAFAGPGTLANVTALTLRTNNYAALQPGVDFVIDTISVSGPVANTAVPEPASVTLLTLGAGGLVARFRRRHSKR